MNISEAIENVDLMMTIDDPEVESSILSSYGPSVRIVSSHLNVISFENWERLMEIGYFCDSYFPDPHDQAEGKCIPHGRFEGWGITPLPDLEPSAENLEEGWPF